MAECGLLTLASCLPERFFAYLSSILNAPLQPLLTIVKNLMDAQVSLDLFVSLWAIIVYMLSMFYAFLIIYAGFTFIISGYDPRKREYSKEWLRNILIMIVLVQASFFIYQLFVDLAGVMTGTTLTLVANNFFYLTIDNLNNIGLEIVLSGAYIITLLITALVLVIRYCVVAIGVVLFPLAIFCYFVQPLRSYGLFLLNFVGIAVFVTFLDAVLLVGFSMLTQIPLFANIKIIVMIAAFALINVMMLFLMFFSVVKGAMHVGTKVAAFAAMLG